MNVRFELDHDGIGELMLSPDMRSMLTDRARGGAQFAQHIAPRVTGQYATSIHAEDGGRGGRKRDRAMTVIVASAPHAAAVEWGNRHRRGRHVLARTLDIVEAG
ncbi:hypothetical protein [Amycolatopsis taiwanensis]|uniref:hypothetical protein n=1 Tax=Amycolatopsis taiwanensis TaxID=342230 RepID=UPI0004841A45|nr:hypothetical protein [Amycolatopsis taiwanensis]